MYPEAYHLYAQGSNKAFLSIWCRQFQKAFQEAHIEYIAGSPAFIFQTTGITVRHDNDVNDPMIGKRVAKAKAFNKACAISRAIIKAAKSGLEEELMRTDATLKAWQEKENKIRKQWQK